MEEVKEFRNLLAHSSASYSQEFLAQNLKDRIVLATYDKSGKRQERIVTLKEVDKKNKVVAEMMKVLLEFQSTIWASRGQPKS